MRSFGGISLSRGALAYLLVVYFASFCDAGCTIPVIVLVRDRKDSSILGLNILSIIYSTSTMN